MSAMQKLLPSSLGLAALIAFAVPAFAADPPKAEAPKPGAPKAEAPKAEAPKPEAPAAPSPEAVAAGKSINWATADVKAKKAHMKKYVLPQMKKLFAAVDKKYAKMSCDTCHGKKAAENKFKMPTAELPKLPGPTDRAGFMALQEKKPEVVKFMGMQVKPTMAALLGKPEWSPTNPEGFGCYGCHTKEEGGAAAPPAGAPPAAPAAKPGAAPPAAPAAKPGAAAPAAPAKGGGW